MYNSKSIFIAIPVVAVLLTGCASMLRGTTESVKFDSSPKGADVYTSNGLECKSTPCEIEVPRNSQFVASIEKEECKSDNVRVSNGVSRFEEIRPYIVANVVLTWGVGLLVDTFTGAMKEVRPNPVIVVLDCD